MAQRSIRPWLAAALSVAATAIFLPACWNAGGLGPLFGAHGGTSGSGGFNPGTGGGVSLKDLFVGARLQLAAPSVQLVAPANGATGVHIKTPIAVQFSESMLASLLKNGVQLFASGSTQSTPASITFFNGDSVVVLVPTSDLIPSTQYQISVSGSLTDLQGQQVSLSGKSGADQRFSFTTMANSDDPPFQVVYSSPAQQERNVPRGTEAVILFSEPFNASISAGGINAPGSVVVRENGNTLTLGTDYQMITFPSANPRAIDIHFTVSAPANATVDVIIDRSVQNADGRKTLKGGNGYTDSYTTQDAAIPTVITFPSSVPVAGKDGAVSAGTLHAFPADVALTADGITPDTTTIIYFDAKQLNALIYSANGANPTDFISDLEPSTTPALLDGDVEVGSYVERGFRSEVSVVETIEKDTIGPRLLALGPPGFGTGVILTQVNDPVIHGRMSEPCTGVQIDFDGAGVPDFDSVTFTAGQATVTDDFFVTGASVDAPLSDAYEGNPTFSFLCSDLFGNGAVNADQFVQVTAGKVGCSVKQPDGTSALYVVAYAGDTFQFLSAGGAVLLDAFPPEPDGLHQIVKGFSANVGVVRFTDAELATIPTSQITVTVVAERGGVGFPRVLLGPVTFTGIDKPTAASPKAIAALLAPDAQVDPNNDVHCAILGASANSPTFAGSGFSFDILPSTPEFDRTVPFVNPASAIQNLLHLPMNQLELFSVTETVTIGSSSLYRFTSSEPFTSEPPPVGGGNGNKSRNADLTGRTQFDAVSHPELVHSIDFDDDQVSYDKTQPPPGLPGPIGLRGSKDDQLREFSIVCRLPGFVDETAVASTTSFTANTPPDFTGLTLLPLPLLQNNAVVAGVGFEDSPLELLLQPALLDPAVAVDTSILKRNLRLEMMVQDKIIFGTTIASSGYTRQRFVFDATAATSSVLAPQSLPTPTVVSSTHPPVLQWNEVTNGEGMHLLRIISVLQLETWKIYVASQAGPQITMQVPFMPPSLPDGLGLVDFATPGTFQCYVESFDFDPNHEFDPTTPEQYTFNPQSFWQSDLEREFLRASRSDPNFVFTTH